jgi:YVTN family beta-propeller protein
MRNRIEPAAPVHYSLILSFLLLLRVGAAPAVAKGGAESIAISPDGTRLYFARTAIRRAYSAGAVSVIDTTTLRVAATLQPIRANGVTQSWPITTLYSMAVSPDGSRLYVAHRDGVDVVDPAANRLLATVSAGPQPLSVAVSPDGQRLYIANGDIEGPNGRRVGGVSVIDTATDKTLATLALGLRSRFALVGPDGRRLFLVGEAGRPQWEGALPASAVQVIDAGTLQVVNTRSLDRTIDGATLSPDGKRLYLTTRPLAGWGPRMDVYDTQSLQLVAGVKIPDGKYVFGWQPVVSPDGKRVYLTMANSSDLIRVLDADTLQGTGALKANRTTNGVSGLTAISPDGKRLYMASVAGDTVQVIDATSLNVEASIGLGNVRTGTP